MKIARTVLLICTAWCCSLVWADPAAWYLWRSPHAEGAICSQISPGEGWVVIKGPYQDGVCKKTGIPQR
ncbi:MAG: hypothetical protein H6R17_718 [Proteobacteria bacterium]|nr:hypothetical protein [Pseudomonadota bacterium]